MFNPLLPIPSRADVFVRAYGGRVILPAHDDYAVESAGWNLAAEQRPVAVVTPDDAEAVRRAVLAARRAGLRVAPQSTGHNAGALTSLADAVLVRTSALQELTIDESARTARIGAGVLWEDVAIAAGKHGLAAPHGSSPNVGVVGFLLGGGLSWYSRRLGLAVNHVRRIDVVLADGQLVTADHETNAELFWALRGGGGSFGVVVAVEIELVPITAVEAGAMIWPQSEAPRVLRAWRDLTTTLSEDVTTTVRLMNFPPLPELPDFLRGRRVVIVDGVVLGDRDAARPFLDRLRALGPELDTFQTIPASEVVRVHMDPEDPVPVVSDSTIVGSLADAALDSLLAGFGPDADPRLLVVEVRHLGGAIARTVPDGGARSSLAGEYLVFAGTVAPTPELAEQGHAAAAEVVRLLSASGEERPYANFVEHPVDARQFHDDATWRRLLAAKFAYDPDDMILGAHPVPAVKPFTGIGTGAGSGIGSDEPRR